MTFHGDAGSDAAHERIRQIITGLVGMMKHGQLPAVDFQDVRTVLLTSRGRAAVGIGQASGPDALAAAVKLALQDVSREIRRAGGNAP
jgi:cell division GTPase FtsZ